LFNQTYRDFDVIIADQSDSDIAAGSPEFQTLIEAFGLHDQLVTWIRRSERRGLAEQRNFLVSQATSPLILFLDNDLLLEPDAIGRMVDVARSQGCGFVGMAPIGLSHRDDQRPHEHNIELWDGPVVPERYTFESVPWERHKLHNAANPLHLSWLYASEQTVLYKVAWVGACVLFDRQKLLDVGGYSWWSELPTEHCGEDVLAELLVMSRYGGCGVLPSGVYHMELPTTVPNRQNNTNDLIRKYLGGVPA
jgi:GT2 family glycosyltransferase